jgi:hypothetical protein
MMRGRNELVLNEATMIEVVQHWLDTTMLNPDAERPRVTSVRAKNDPYSPTFEVTLESEVMASIAPAIGQTAR